jgi:hypothetical protein
LDSDPATFDSQTSDSDIGAAARNSLQELHLAMMSMSEQLSPTTPGHGLPPQGFATSPASQPSQQRGFKRSASSDEDDFQNGDAEGSRPASARRNMAVKRACNECRQQKVSLRVSVQAIGRVAAQR